MKFQSIDTTQQIDLYWDDLCQNTQRRFIESIPEWVDDLNKEFPIATIIIEE